MSALSRPSNVSSRSRTADRNHVSPVFFFQFEIRANDVSQGLTSAENSAKRLFKLLASSTRSKTTTKIQKKIEWKKKKNEKRQAKKTQNWK